MTFRTRILISGLVLAVAPLALFGVRARQDVTARLRALDQRRVDGLAAVIADEMTRQSEAVEARLDRLAEAMADDNRLRVAVRGAAGADRAYLLDYAARAMRLSGLDVLRIQDQDGHVLSSGHFRNEYDIVDPTLPEALRRAGDQGALVAMPTASGSLLALARARSVRLGPRTLTLVGGTTVDEAFLARLARGTGLDVTLRGAPGIQPQGAAGPTDRAPPGASRVPGSSAMQTPGLDTVTAGPGGAYVRVVRLRAVDDDDGLARVEVRASTAPLVIVLRGLDRWLLFTVAAAAALALLLALLVSARLGRPLTALAGKADRLDLDRLDVSFATDRRDEIGTLSRVLDRMAIRLRASAARLRDAERRATIGDLARQVNHDVRNGLTPIRNVVRHLAELARDRPDELPSVFRERQQTLESSVEYLEALADSYARLSPRAERRPCDLNAVVREVVSETSPLRPSQTAHEAAPTTERHRPTPHVSLELQPGLEALEADPVALRRIVENLVVNALESLEGDDAGVTVTTRRGDGDLVLEVADTGRGMQPDERGRIFQDFYTTKARGTGLGLSIVRRLVSDLGGRIDVDSAPGEGSRFRVILPAPGRADSPADPDPDRSVEART